MVIRALPITQSIERLQAGVWKARPEMDRDSDFLTNIIFILLASLTTSYFIQLYIAICYIYIGYLYLRLRYNNIMEEI